jgi:hypothetical protein
MYVSGNKKNEQILDISPLFLHTVLKLIQALIIMYDEIFLALVLEGDVLFLTQFLDLGFDSIIRWR